MKIRRKLILAFGLITVLALLAFSFYNYVQPKLPPNINSPIILIVAITSGTMFFLASLKDIIDLVEKLFSNASFDNNKYDVYISFSVTDKNFVFDIANQLTTSGLKIWITDKQLQPGKPFEVELQQALKKSKTIAIFIGQRGLTQWIEKELNWAIQENKHVIPVVLPNIPYSALQVSTYLQQRRAISFSGVNDANALNELIWGIKGKS